jgi:hypothetical protein
MISTTVIQLSLSIEWDGRERQKGMMKLVAVRWRLVPSVNIIHPGNRERGGGALVYGTFFLFLSLLYQLFLAFASLPLEQLDVQEKRWGEIDSIDPHRRMDLFCTSMNSFFTGPIFQPASCIITRHEYNNAIGLLLLSIVEVTHMGR